MTISGGSALPKEEIDRMVREAEQHAEEDKKRREEAEARNTAEQVAYSTEKFLADSGDKVPAETRASVDEALADLKAALAKTGDDAASVDELNAKVTKLNEESQKMGSAIYAAAQAEQAQDGAAGADGAAGDDDVVDAEVVDDDEPKK